MKNTNEMPSDGGWGWAVVFGAFVYNVFNVGTHKALGVFVPEFADGLDLSVGAVGTSCGVGAGLKTALGPIWAACILCANARTLTFLGGVLTGLGFIAAGLSTNQTHLTLSMVVASCGVGLPIVAIPGMLKEYFHKKYSLATGLALSGCAIGMIVFPPIFEFLIETYGWRNALFLLGASCFNICAAGTLFRPVNSSLTHKHCQCIGAHYKKTFDGLLENTVIVFKSILSYTGVSFFLQNKTFILGFISFLLWGIAFTGWVLFLVSYAIDIGFSPQDASVLSAIGGVGTFIGRVALPPLIDSKRVSGQTIFILLSLTGAIFLFLYPFCSSYWSMGLISLLTGISIGSPPPVMVVILKELTSDYKAEDFTGAVGFHFMCIGIGLFAGGPLCGYIFDATGSYNWAYYAMAGAELIAAILVCSFYMIERRHTLVSTEIS